MTIVAPSFAHYTNDSPIAISRPVSATKEVMMAMNRQECANYFAARFRTNATWRIGLAAKFCTDSRNVLAATRLLELKAGIEISDAMWDRLSPHFSETDARWCKAVADSNSDVGFRQHPRDFSSWVDNLLSHLTGIEQVTK